MAQPAKRWTKPLVFGLFVLSCVLFATGYVAWSAQRPQTPEQLPLQPLFPGEATASTWASVQEGPHLLSVNLARPETRDWVQLSTLDQAAPQTALAPLQCFRVHYAGGIGLCLQYGGVHSSVTDVAAAGKALVFGADFLPHTSYTYQGYPSRARVSPDGRFVAYTVFTAGHSYNEKGMSTATHIIEVATQRGGNLEEFDLWHNGEPIRPIDANFWGVTFARESNHFYATLKYGEVVYLVEGDFAARRITVLRPGVECPSLSPDETRIAFKKQTGGGGWRLAVLTLATGEEILMSETESVDDQVEWLDNDHLLYQRIDPDPPPWLSIMRVRADGTGQPQVFLAGASSPAVVQ